MMKKTIATMTGGFLLAILFVSLAAAKETPSVALKPTAKTDQGWVKRFESEVENMNKGNVDLLMVGDSITQGWEGAGKTVWDNYYPQRKPINLGISGDRTEHVLWRLDNLPLDKIKPKAAVVMIGTNNIGHNSSSPKEAALGVKAIVERLEKAYPEMKQLVLYVFPRGATPEDGMRKKVDEINSYLPELLQGKPNVTLLDLNAKFLDADKNLPDEIMKDKLHPGTYGYEIWAAAMEPTLTKFLDEKNPAVEPKDKLNDKRKDSDKLWWKEMHEKDAAEMEKGEAQFLMVGDSITHGWDGHKGLMDKYFGEFKPLNLGIGGDRTEHVLWRLDHLPLDKIQPKVAMVMIGTNNIGNRNNTPWMIAQGVKAIVEKLHKAYPEMKIVVLDVFPRGDKKDHRDRLKVGEINFCLPEALAGIKNVELMDVGSIYLTEDGEIPKEIMGDFLHPGAKGYEMWGEKIAPVIKAKFESK